MMMLERKEETRKTGPGCSPSLFHQLAVCTHSDTFHSHFWLLPHPLIPFLTVGVEIPGNYSCVQLLSR
ncbi:hypothetical protein E2C01_024873 [Portunus trituberculatus]|uniref:Uncharacterized protein n=1 Tax=Portunus trituberculatus TaxID=210409 RepID=A0A5B7EDK7_PORTR|nr:hypothetical protein [Portunus trituberculatus]